MQRIHPALVLGLMAFWVGCSSLSVTHDYDRHEDFAALRTFDWMGQPHEGTAGSDTGQVKRLGSLFDARLKKAVNSQLEARGLKQHADNPDFLITYHTGSEAKINITSYGYGYGPYWGAWGGPFEVQQYTEGTLVLDFVDAKSRQIVWRGIATKAVASRPKPSETEARINEVVVKLLVGFPPTPGK